MMLTRKRAPGLLAGAALVSTLLSACGGGTGSDGAAVTLATGVDPAYTMIYVAQEEGLFEKNGLDVRILQTEGGPAPTQALIAGEAQFATNTEATSMSLFGANSGLRALGVIADSDRYLKVVFAPGVDSSEDIKKMAVAPGQLAFLSHEYLKSEGVDPDGVEFVQAAPPELPALVRRGDIDAFIGFDPWVGRSVDAGAKVVADIGDFGMTAPQWLNVQKSWLDDNEETADRIMTAISEADRWVTAHPNEAAEVISEAVKMDTTQALAAIKESTFETRDFTAEDLERAETTAGYFVDSGSVDKAPDVTEQVLRGWLAKNGAQPSS